MSDDRGRWFRVYARQVKLHPKFRDLTGLELGAWTALRSECELRDGATLTDRADAVLILKRRHVARAPAMVDRLLGLRLFDEEADGTITVHDRADHDRPKYPSDSPEKVAERVRRHRETNGNVSLQNGNETPARVQPQQAAPASANSRQPQPGEGLPADDDSATAACRLFLSGGRWLGDSEYVAAWEDMDRRFTSEWVKAEIDPAYAELYAINPKVKPWDLQHKVEFLCAERARIEELEREKAEREKARKERERLNRKEDSATDEEKRRASITRRAIGLWIKRRPNDPVPSDFDQLEAWLQENKPDDSEEAAA